MLYHEDYLEVLKELKSEGYADVESIRKLPLIIVNWVKVHIVKC